MSAAWRSRVLPPMATPSPGHFPRADRREGMSDRQGQRGVGGAEGEIIVWGKSGFNLSHIRRNGSPQYRVSLPVDTSERNSLSHPCRPSRPRPQLFDTRANPRRPPAHPAVLTPDPESRRCTRSSKAPALVCGAPRRRVTGAFAGVWRGTGGPGSSSLAAPPTERLKRTSKFVCQGRRREWGMTMGMGMGLGIDDIA